MARVIARSESRRVRQPAEPYRPTAIRIPDDAVGQMQIVADISPADYEDDTHWLTATIEWFTGRTWQPLARAEWKGGRFIDEDGVVNPPVVLLALTVYADYGRGDIINWRGQTLRVTVDSRKQIDIGYDVQIERTTERR